MVPSIVRHPVVCAAARWLVLLVALVWLVQALDGAQGKPWPMARPAWQVWCVLGLVGSLAAVNWWLESVKWRRLVRPVVHVSGAEAFRATLSGTTLGLVTPNRTGEFLGRIAHLPAPLRARAALVSVPGSIAQFAVTLVAGMLGLLLLWGTATDKLPLHPGWLLAGVAAIAVPVLLLARPDRMVRLLLRLPLPGAWRRALTALAPGQAPPAPAILALSALRYAVFTLQFLLLLLLFAPGVPWPHACGAVPVIFLITTLVPTALLSELGVRGSVAVAVLVPLQAEALPVLSATFTLWLANLALPALVGGVMLVAARRGARA